MKKFFTFLMVLMMAVGSLFAGTQSETYSSSVPTEAPDVMLQAFYWDSYTDHGYGNTRWETLLGQAEEIGSYFDLVWLPPCSESSGGTGYIPKTYSNLNSDWGSESQLRSLISALHNKNARVMADIVVNHNGASCGWCCFGAMNFGAYGTFYPDGSWLTTEDEVWSQTTSCTVGANAHADDGYGDERNYSAARDWDHQNTQVQEMMRAYLKWMKNDVGFDGWRYDYGKGFHHSHINDYNSAAGAYFSVVEYWDGNPDVLRARLEDADWNNTVFDFGIKYDALNNGICSFNYAKCKAPGLFGKGLRRHAVTFVDNHDTFTRNDSEFGGQNNSMSSDLKDRLLQANAYILSMPGIPCVFYPHWVTHKEAIKKMIEARHKTGVHSESEVKDEYAEQGGYQATIVGKKGYIVLQLGNKAGNDIPGFTKYASGNGYAIWVYTNGYYLKNNWKGGEWSWMKMTEDGDNFKLENVVFGGNGVNYNTTQSDDGATWVAVGDFKGDAIGALDTVNLVLNPTAGTITAKLLGKYVKPETPEEPEEPQEVDSMTVYMVNTLGWEKVNGFVWGEKAYKEWPGEAAKKEAEQINGKDVYAYTFPASFANLIFNDGTAQTVDLTWEEAKPYFVPGEKSGEKYKGTWYAKAEIPVDETPEEPEEPEEPQEVDSMTVYMVNTLGWEKVNGFVWPAEGSAYKEWPGEAAKKEAEQINGKDVYAYTFPASFVNLIFNDGSAQTVDLTWEEAKPYFVPGEKEGAKFKGTWYAKADIPTDEPEQPEEPETHAKYYITGDEALVVGAGLTADKAWNPSAIKSEKDTFVLNLKADQYYVLKVTVDGTWSTTEGNINGYNELTEKTPGLDDVSNDHNIGFKLNTAGEVKVVYTSEVFKLIGDFYVKPEEPEQPEEPQATKDLKLVPGVWAEEGAVLAAWAWSATVDGAWYLFEGENDTLVAKVNAEVDKVIFVRFANGETPDWDATIWNKTTDYTIEDCGVFFVNTWDNYSWCEKQTPPESVTISFYSDWNVVFLYIWQDDHEPLHEWPGSRLVPVDGKVSATWPKNEGWHIIFNDGNYDYDIKQTQTIDFTENACYVWGGHTAVLDSDCNGEVGGDEPGEPEEPVEHVYSVAGSAAIFGSNWNAAEGNEMIKQEDGSYKLVIEDVELSADIYEFKVVIDHKWNNGEAEDNSQLVIDKSGKYDVTITYNPTTATTEAKAVLKEAVVVIPAVQLAGTFSEWDAKDLTLDDSKLFASVKVNLEKGNYEFKMIIGGNWRGNGQEITRDNPGLTGLITNAGNLKLSADTEGDYIFTWTFANDSLGITFPEKSAEPDRLQEGYYLIGLNGWTVESIQPADMFTVNPSDADEYFLADVTLKEGASFKAVYVKNDAIDSWIPDGEGNDYVVDAAHAGKKTIYFRPAGSIAWEGHFYVAPNTATDVETIQASGKVVKVLRNGQLYLMYNGRMYNVQGKVVK